MFRYEERVTFHPFFQVLYLVAVGAVVVGQWAALPELAWAPFLVGVPLILLPLMFGRLLIRVDAERLLAQFGFLGWPAQRIPLEQIERARAVTYRPILQFGGWGIRTGRFEGERTSVYTVRGSTGVLLELEEERRVSGFRTKRFLVGSLEPERLLAVLGKP